MTKILLAIIAACNKLTPKLKAKADLIRAKTEVNIALIALKDNLKEEKVLLKQTKRLHGYNEGYKKKVYHEYTMASNCVHNSIDTYTNACRRYAEAIRNLSDLS
jgi:hypothetical protein